MNEALTAEIMNQLMVSNATTLRRAILDKVLSTERDINYECKYPDIISPIDYRTMYEREGIGTRVVQLMPEESWNVIPEVLESTESTESTELTESSWDKEWKELVLSQNIWHYLFRLDVLSGIGQFGALLIGINDALSLDQPAEGIDPVSGVASESSKVSRELTYLKPFDESMLIIKESEKDVTSPRFSYPTMYGLKINNAEVVVHWTRILHAADNRGVSDIHGVPRMRPVYNRLLDIRKTLGGSGEMFWKSAAPGYAFEITPERATQLSTEEKEEFKDELENYMNGLQRYIALAGMKATSLTPQMADPSNHFTTQIKAIAITLGAPYRVFLGTEEAKLAGAQDTRAWLRRIKKRQDVYLSPLLVRPFINRLMNLRVLAQTEYEVTWPDIDSLDEKTAADVVKIRTEALAAYVDSGVDTLIPPLEYLTKIYGMDLEEAAATVKAITSWVADRGSEETRSE